MKKGNIESSLLQHLKGKKIPVLVLDSRWHQLFPPEQKTQAIRQLEEQLNGLLKEQGKLVNEVKECKRAKKLLMDEIVMNMGKMSDKKSRETQRLIYETTERIEKDSHRLMDLPYEIKKANQQLLVAGMKICYEKMSGRRDEIEDLSEEINVMRELLKSKVAYKVKLEEEQEYLYSFLHTLLGPEIIEIFDNK